MIPDQSSPSRVRSAASRPGPLRADPKGMAVYEGKEGFGPGLPGQKEPFGHTSALTRFPAEAISGFFAFRRQAPAALFLRHPLFHHRKHRQGDEGAGAGVHFQGHGAEPPLLFIDGIDRVKPDQKGIITDILRAIEANEHLSNWKVLASSRDYPSECATSGIASGHSSRTRPNRTKLAPWNSSQTSFGTNS